MNKSLFIIVILFVIALVVSGIGGCEKEVEKQLEELEKLICTPEFLCEEETETEDKFYCWSELAVYKKDKSLCKKIKGSAAIPGLALKVCEAPFKRSCGDVLLLEVGGIIEKEWGEEAANYYRSEEFPELLGKCYSKKALLHKDSSYCEKIEDETDREVCFFKLALWKNDVSLCNKSIRPEQCEIFLAIKNQNKSLCTSEWKRQKVCMVLAVSLNDTNLCEMIPRVIPPDAPESYAIGRQIFDYHYCVAYVSKNSTICDQIPSSYKRLKEVCRKYALHIDTPFLLISYEYLFKEECPLLLLERGLPPTFP